MTQKVEKQERLERCMELFASHQKRLQLFIGGMLPNPADADEVLQETNIVIWKKFEQFDADGSEDDFLSWAFRIAGLQVLEFRRRQARKATGLSTEVLEQLMVTAQSHQPVLELRRDALRFCMQKLPEEDRALLNECYGPNANIPEIAAAAKRTATSVYRSLRRIRKALGVCIERRLAQES